jgi:hypothetical protein
VGATETHFLRRASAAAAAGTQEIAVGGLLPAFLISKL